ncbi:unnamed protein product, partial [Ixodes persulcatus]
IEQRSRRRLSISTPGRRLLKLKISLYFNVGEDVFSNVVQTSLQLNAGTTSFQRLCRRLFSSMPGRRPLKRCADVSSVQCRDDVFSNVMQTSLQFNAGTTSYQTS